jgi:excisionase family DNA binding protein
MDTYTRTPIQRYAYSLDEAGESLGMSRPGVYGLIRAGKLKTLKLGRRRLVPADELRRLCTVGEVA